MKTLILSSLFSLAIILNLTAQWTDNGSFISPTSQHDVYIDGTVGQSLFFENNGSANNDSDHRGIAWSLDVSNFDGDNDVGDTLFTQYYDYVFNRLIFDTDFDSGNGTLMTMSANGGDIDIHADDAIRIHPLIGDIWLDADTPTSVDGDVLVTVDDDFIVQNNTVTTMMVTNDNRVGIGVITPLEKLDVNGGIRLGNALNNNNGTIRWTGTNLEGRVGGSWLSLTASGPSQWTLDGSDIYYTTGNVGIGTSTPNFDLQVAGDLDVTGEVTATSDIQIKKNINTVENAMQLISGLHPVSYDFRYDEFPDMNLSERRKMGLVAQEVEQVLPNLVSSAGVVTNSSGEDIALKSVNYIELIPLLVKAVQELEAELEQKNTVIAELSTQLEKVDVLALELDQLKKLLTVNVNQDAGSKYVAK